MLSIPMLINTIICNNCGNKFYVDPAWIRKISPNANCSSLGSIDSFLRNLKSRLKCSKCGSKEVCISYRQKEAKHENRLAMPVTNQNTRINNRRGEPSNNICIVCKKNIPEKSIINSNQKTICISCTLKNEKRKKSVKKEFGNVEKRSGYGICIDCGKTISVDRLDKVPETTRCVECQSTAEMKLPKGYSRKIDTWGNMIKRKV